MSTAPDTTTEVIIENPVTNIIFQLKAPKDTYSPEYLFSKVAPRCHDQIKFDLTEGWLGENGKLFLFREISKQATEIEVELTSCFPCPGWDNILCFGIANIPQLPDDDGIPITDEDDPDKIGIDDIGISGDEVPIIFVWNSREKKGNVVAYDNESYRVLTALDPATFSGFESPISDLRDVVIPQPYGYKFGGWIDKADIFK